MTYDAGMGNNYSYDAENRITGTAGYTYTYDADGNRVAKSNGSTGTIYWSMTPGGVAESDLSGNLQSEYMFFGLCARICKWPRITRRFKKRQERHLVLRSFAKM